ncbi:long-chain fatty acid transport protein [Marinobacter daqiaonensis]|uniref:Long-chain fatty acid transport protein n=1 Tax=Marinobacter daqiaonensis TaxID=650891 RepID=A0A1I6GZT7_9GAMM|nr:outer membrane protein transport protein [Marinobacter daqiaonensis]SFR47551.1 long-chain fatty acid transport protein [Marinobacter daqiaonensis]
MKPQNGFRIAVAAAGLMGLIPAASQASSFQILEQSPARLGTAFSGTASAANDATTVFFNPAGMTELGRREVSAAGHLIHVESSFDNEGSTAADGSPLQQPLSGSSGETDEMGFVPNLYFVQPIADRWRFGLGINAPFGLVTEYDNGWIGRYHGTKSELQVLNINPTFAFEVTGQLSVGFGLSYQRIDTTLENEVDSFAACLAAPGATAPTCAAAHGGPGNRPADSSVEIEGDDSDVVADLSVHWRPLQGTRVGLVWRQGGDFTIEGDADFSPSSTCASDPACSATGQAIDGNVEADLELPDTLTLSASHRLTEAWQLHADIAWTEWSSVKEIGIVNIDSNQTIDNLNLQYDDTMRYALGASFEPQGPWTWRFGLAFDEAPQTDQEFVSVRIPDQDRFWTSVGFNYAFSRNASVDVGYAHLFVDDSQINKVEQGNRLRGNFDSQANIVGIQANWRF